MPCIGVRVTPKEVFYVVVTGSSSSPNIVHRSRLTPPVACDLPQKLAWYREQVLHLFAEYEATSCGVKTSEPSSQGRGAGVAQRHNAEGVIMEAVAFSGHPCVIGPWTTIGSRLGIRKPKDVVEGDDFRAIPQWRELTKDFREATLAGIAALAVAEDKR